jgi:predicted nucleic acid-binding protein
MIVVSDTSAIINLAMIGRLDLLHQLYNEVIIPAAVYQEIVVQGAGKPGAVEVRTQSWFKQRVVLDTAFVSQLRRDLDDGEAEAIVLAQEIGADLLLIDDRAARRHAARLGLRFIGLLSVLLEAKKAGLLATVKPPLDDLISKAGFRVHSSLYHAFLASAGE